MNKPTEIVVTGGLAGGEAERAYVPGQPHTWTRLLGETPDQFRARVRAEAASLPAQALVFGGLPD